MRVERTDENEPQQENSFDFDHEPSMPFQAQLDEIEGTKNFEHAYGKLISKFYHHEGANLLIPQEDMVMHQYNMENRQRVDVEDLQRKIRENALKKEERIRQAKFEQELKEMEECSFAPKINRLKRKSTMAPQIAESD